MCPSLRNASPPSLPPDETPLRCLHLPSPPGPLCAGRGLASMRDPASRAPVPRNLFARLVPRPAVDCVPCRPRQCSRPPLLRAARAFRCLRAPCGTRVGVGAWRIEASHARYTHARPGQLRIPLSCRRAVARLLIILHHSRLPRLFHRVTGTTGLECPAPVPVPGTGRYRPVMMFVLAPHTDWPTCPGRLLIGFGQRQTAARAVCGPISSVLRWQRDGPWAPDGKRAWAVPVA
jgi:hypothetical protein